MPRVGMALGVTGLVLATTAPAFAANEDTNIWLAQSANIDLGGDMALGLEVQERFTNDASRLSQIIFRPSLSYKLDQSTTISLGYAYVHNDPQAGASTNEHRAHQQISFRVAGDGKGVTITGRTRFEQRFLEEIDGTAFRIRQQFRLTAPLSGKVRAVAWTEALVGLNQTGFQRDGLGLWRNYAGVSVPVSKFVSLEPGYLNQYVVRNGTDRIDHVANLTLSAAF
jgi:Protein of unknown function (DUF2490)